MKQSITTILLLLLAIFATAQTVYEPQILILSPNQIKYDKIFKKEISETNEYFKKHSNLKEMSDYVQSSDFNNLPENVQLMMRAEAAFLENLDVFTQASFGSEQYLASRFYERFPNVLLLLSKDKSKGNLSDLASHSKKANLQYVLNFPKIELFKQNKISYAKVDVQLYDSSIDSIVLHKTYVGDWYNPGFESACQDSSINCTIGNAVSQALKEIIYIIASNNPTLKRERQLSQERAAFLAKTLLNKPVDKSFLDNIIPKSDSALINTAHLFQSLVSEDKTKFVGFFLEQIAAQDFKTFKENQKEKHITIKSDVGLGDEGFLNKMPQTHAYIVYGVLYNNKWYYKTSNATYFPAKSIAEGREEYFNHLQGWNFFKENSVELNPDFWETYFFSKVESFVKNGKEEIEELKKLLAEADSSRKETYRLMLNNYGARDAANKEYIGLYEIVADEFRKEKKEQHERFATKINKEVLSNFYASTDSEKFIKPLRREEYALIFPSDKSILISPVVIDYGNDHYELHYHVLIPNAEGKYDIYNWLFFKPMRPQSNNSGYTGDIYTHLNKITSWNWGMETLDDKNFWNQYVLLKEGDSYKYLQLIQK